MITRVRTMGCIRVDRITDYGRGWHDLLNNRHRLYDLRPTSKQRIYVMLADRTDDACRKWVFEARLLIPPEFPGIPLNSFLWEFKGRKPRFPFRGTPKGTRRKISSVMYVLYVQYVPFTVPLLWLEERPFPLLQKEFPGNMRNSLHFLPSIPKRNKGSKRN